MNAVLASLIRTLVPWIVAVAGPAAARWFGLTEDQLTTGATLLVGALYYFVVRLLELWLPQLGWLLGYASPPQYAGPAAAARKPDAGRAGALFAVVLAGVALLVLAGSTAAVAVSTHGDHLNRVHLNRAELCSGRVVAWFDLQRGRQTVPDDGHAVLVVFDAAGRAATGGGEGAPGEGGVHASLDLLAARAVVQPLFARVVHDGYRPSAVARIGACAA